MENKKIIEEIREFWKTNPTDEQTSIYKDSIRKKYSIRDGRALGALFTLSKMGPREFKARGRKASITKKEKQRNLIEMDEKSQIQLKNYVQFLGFNDFNEAVNFIIASSKSNGKVIETRLIQHISSLNLKERKKYFEDFESLLSHYLEKELILHYKH